MQIVFDPTIEREDAFAFRYPQTSAILTAKCDRAALEVIFASLDAEDSSENIVALFSDAFTIRSISERSASVPPPINIHSSDLFASPVSVPYHYSGERFRSRCISASLLCSTHSVRSSSFFARFF